MSKSNDRVEWGFLEAVMLKLGFCEAWVERVMRMVTSISYSVVVNGSIEEEFYPIRGLHQGDPLSPYLFLFYGRGYPHCYSWLLLQGRYEVYRW